MTPPVFATAYADATVKSLLGTTPCRLYPFGEAPEGVALPYAVWQTIGGAPENALNSVPDIDNFATQIDVYASSASSARAVAEALRDAFEPVAHVTRWNGESKNPDTKRYRYSFDVDWLTER